MSMQPYVPTCPLVLPTVSCGFPSPAIDTEETALNLHSYAVANPAATFFVRATGESMAGAGLLAGDILVVDRSREPQPGNIVVAVVDGEFLVKRYVQRGGQTFLAPSHPDYPELRIDQREDVQIWGVVTFALHEFS